MHQKINVNKTFLIAGVVILALSLCIFLFEYNEASFVSDMKFTFLTLTIAMLTFMYSFMGKYFFKGLILLFCSCIFSITCWFIFFPKSDLTEKSSKFFEITLAILSFFENFTILYMGTVTGIIAGLFFMLINYKFIKIKNRYQLFFTRLISYLLILGTVSILFAIGGDWIFEISEYFKSKF